METPNKDTQSSASWSLASPAKKRRADTSARAAAWQKCEDPRHLQVDPHSHLNKSAEDDVVRCSSCRARNKKAQDAVGTRGLRLKAYFRARPDPQGDASAKPSAGTSLAESKGTSGACVGTAMNSCGSSPALSSGPPIPKKSIATQMAEYSQKLKEQHVQELEELLKQEPDEGFAPDTTGKVRELFATKFKSEVPDLQTPTLVDAKDGGVETSQSDVSDDSVDLWLGCDKCSRWYLVDKVLHDNWKDRPFMCTAVSESCAEEETCTALVPQQDVGETQARDGSVPTAMLPRGCWDIYPASGDLAWPGSRVEQELSVFCAPLGATTEALRLQIEELMYEAFSSPTITELVGLQAASDLVNVRTRSGAQFYRMQPVDVLNSCQRWLIWETLGECMVGAAILTKQVHTKAGPAHLQGGVVLEYIASKRHAGGKAYLMISAASEICRLLGFREIFSACDVNHTGHAFDGKASPAMAAHRRWGFNDMDQEEWQDRRLESYTRLSRVHYMVKPLV